MVNNREIFEIIDYQSRVLVGVLLKRIEILYNEKSLTPTLYKALVKEQVYEQFRTLKKLIEINSNNGKVIFKTKEK